MSCWVARMPCGRQDRQLCDGSSQIGQDPLSGGPATIPSPVPQTGGGRRFLLRPTPRCGAAETNGLRRTSPGPPPPVFLPGANLSFTEKHSVNNELGGVL